MRYRNKAYICVSIFKINIMKTFVSDLSQKRFPFSEKISGESVRLSIMQLIQQDHPDFDATKTLSIRELNQYREKYMAQYLTREVGELSDLDSKVLQSIREHSIISDNVDEQNRGTLGQRVADKVASFGGSWTFIILFSCFLLGWIALNAFWFFNRGFDPYPFILLNLILSCLAAMQAPIIMMSQNRQGEKDRERAKEDYMVNLKAELEVRALHEKIDHLMLYQQQEMIEIQKIQMDMLSEIRSRIEKNAKTNREKSEVKKENHEPL